MPYPNKKNVIPHFDLHGYHTHNIYPLHCRSDTWNNQIMEQLTPSNHYITFINYF